jgi:hypothetical protein
MDGCNVFLGPFMALMIVDVRIIMFIQLVHSILCSIGWCIGEMLMCHPCIGPMGNIDIQAE